MKRIFFSLLMMFCVGVVNAQNKAEIKFEKTTHHFGTLTEEKPLATCTFTFTNVGDAPLTIHQAFASCGCTVPEFTRDPVEPGKKGTIKITYNSRGMQGHFKKVITIRSDAKTSMVRLIVEGDVVKKKKE